MDLTMPTMLAWVLGGNANKLRFQDRAPHCRLPDKPKTFHEQVLQAPATGCTCKLLMYLAADVVRTHVMNSVWVWALWTSSALARGQ